MAYKYQRLLDKLEQDEGFRENSYRDHLGKLTIGIGWLLPPEEGGEPLPPGYKAPLTRAQGLELARYKIEQKATALARIDTFNTLDADRQELLVECAYQIGVGGLTKFKKMWAALARKDFQAAAEEMLDSKVAQEQTPARWQAHAKRMRGESETETADAPVTVDSTEGQVIEVPHVGAVSAVQPAAGRLEPEDGADFGAASVAKKAERAYRIARDLGITRTEKEFCELAPEFQIRWALYTERMKS